MPEYTKTSVGAYDKKPIKEDLYTSNSLLNGAPVQKHSQNAWRSLKNNLEVVMHDRESAHTYGYAWLGEEKHLNGTKPWEFKRFLELLVSSLSAIHRSEGDAASMQRAPAYVQRCTRWKKGTANWDLLLQRPDQITASTQGHYLTRKKSLRLVLNLNNTRVFRGSFSCDGYDLWQ